MPQRVTRLQKKRRAPSTSDLEPRTQKKRLVESNSKQQRATAARKDNNLGKMNLRPRIGLARGPIRL